MSFTSPVLCQFGNVFQWTHRIAIIFISQCKYLVQVNSRQYTYFINLCRYILFIDNMFCTLCLFHYYIICISMYYVLMCYNMFILFYCIHKLCKLTTFLSITIFFFTINLQILQIREPCWSTKIVLAVQFFFFFWQLWQKLWCSYSGTFTVI